MSAKAAKEYSEEEARKIETREWLASLEEVLGREGAGRAAELLQELVIKARKDDVPIPYQLTTPYVNTISVEEQPPYPGNLEIERRPKSIIRWNAMAMVVRANREMSGIGGHISTYASQATLYEVGYNHFFRARTDEHPGDHVYWQGHATPGNYARSFVEGRLSKEQLENFRRELQAKAGVSSYPHPWLMPDYWQFPTVSMGLGPIQAICHARLIQYMIDRGLKEPSDERVWAMLGDGETDEPEALGALTLAARENLDRLIFVVNCNLQRLDGPVRGNGKIVQELEARFRGAGWNVIKVCWGSNWDPLFKKDKSGLLTKRLEKIVDGQLQKYVAEDGGYIREDLFGADDELLELVSHMSDEEINKLRPGGHDPQKVYAAYKAAVQHEGSPTAILAQTIKGYGLGEAGEGRNISHKTKTLNEDELREFRSRFAVPIADEDLEEAPFYRPEDDSPEMKYCKERLKAMGGHLPARRNEAEVLEAPDDEVFKEFFEGSGERAISTTMAYVRLLMNLLDHEKLGERIVPIIPDEARTFGMDTLFRKYGIYKRGGQQYEPVDVEHLLYYKESGDGQILEEGISEAASVSSFIAAGTAYANHGISLIPFFAFYSMFGFQRVGDLIWAAGDSQAKGFLIGCISGRTTLPGEGLQHQDGNSHVYALAYPNVRAYDPTFAYELAVIVQDGMRRMYEEDERCMYYITVTNENYEQPEMPEGVREGIVRGLYKYKAAEKEGRKHRAQLLGSGAILNEALKAQEMLKDYDVAADVWSATSYKELYRDAVAAERWNQLHPDEEPRRPYVLECLEETDGPVIAVTDYVRALPETIGRWLCERYTTLGTDGFGRSDGRPELRDFFEVDAAHIVLSTLAQLARDGEFDGGAVTKAIENLGIEPDKPDPVSA